MLLPLGDSLGILSATQGSLLSAIAAITLLIGPPFATLTEVAAARLRRATEREADDFDGASGSVLVIGFGRFGQIVSQYLLAEDIDVTTIDLDPEHDPGRRAVRLQGLLRRRHAARRAARGRPREGAADRDLHRQGGASQPHRRSGAGGISRHEDFRALLRSRPHTAAARQERRLRAARDVRVRNRFGRKTLEAIGIDADRAAIVEDFIRTRDRDRIAIQQAEGIYAGIDLLRTRPTPTPFSELQRDAKALNMEAGELIAGTDE